MRSPRCGWAVLLVFATLACLVAPSSYQPAGAVTPDVSRAAIPVGPYGGPGKGGAFGVALPGLPGNLEALSAFEKLVGRSVSIVSYYQDFASGPNFNAQAATSIWDLGATPMLAWEPEDDTGPVTDQPAYSLESIITGAHDALITRWANEVAAWGKPIWLRFAPEMNGNWNPWSPGVNGNLAGQYVQAWRHVYDIFSRAGATNVVWVWDPSVAYQGSTPLAELYPGNAYVDVVGLDGYNWGTSRPGQAWESPGQVFGPTVMAVRRITNRPIVLCEVASTEIGGNKAQWISEFFAYLKENPVIRGFVWFNFNKETDWRVQSSPASERAFIAGISLSDFH
jgi:hypothetical protein